MSIIIQHKTEAQALDESTTGQLLNNKMLNVVKELVADKKRLVNKFNTITKILNVGTLTPEIVNILIRPWHRANMLKSLWGEVSWVEEKEKASDYIDIIEKFEKLLNRDSGNINMLMLFMTTTELNLEQIKLILKELKDFYSIFIAHEVRNGGDCSANYFIRYGINSLFYMAKEIGLKERGSPTQLNKYILLLREYMKKSIKITGSLKKLISLEPLRTKKTYHFYLYITLTAQQIRTSLI